MRKFLILSVVTITVVIGLFGGAVQQQTALAFPAVSECASLTSWTGSFYFKAGDIISAIYTATSGGVGAEIYIEHKGPAGATDTKSVPSAGKYILSLTIPTDGVYTIYNHADGATGSFSLPICGLIKLDEAAPPPAGDPDDDGISGDRDNCPYNYNPSQEDGWGSGAGDLCDTDWYNNTGQGLSGFEQKDGTYNLHGNCTYMNDGDPRCPVIASFDPTTFTPDIMPMNVTTGDAGTMSIIVYYLHSNNGYPVYQVNVYSTNPPQPQTLVDDRLEIHVSGDGWRWWNRGGNAQYQGRTYSSGG